MGVKYYSWATALEEVSMRFELDWLRRENNRSLGNKVLATTIVNGYKAYHCEIPALIT